MKMDELERMIYEQVWSEESEKEDGVGADGWNGKNGVRKRRRNSWRLLKQVIPARGYVRYENSVFRVEQRQHGQLVIAPKHRYVRITARGRKFVEEAKEIAKLHSTGVIKERTEVLEEAIKAVKEEVEKRRCWSEGWQE